MRACACVCAGAAGADRPWNAVSREREKECVVKGGRARTYTLGFHRKYSDDARPDERASYCGEPVLPQSGGRALDKAGLLIGISCLCELGMRGALGAFPRRAVLCGAGLWLP